MKKCIYLKKTEPDVSFNTAEHIIPAGIGGISKLDKGMVSDEVNTKIFSNIELDFMRNSIISLLRQFDGHGKRGALSIKKATKSNLHVMFTADGVEEASLGYIKKAKPYQVPQVKIINTNQINLIFDKSEGNYKTQLVHFIEELENFDGKYYLIIEDNIPSNQVILGKFKGKWYLAARDSNINYSICDIIRKVVKQSTIMEEQPKYSSSQTTSHMPLSFNREKNFRVCAKIVFNFLAFSQGTEFVLHERFDKIREWIVRGGVNEFVDWLDKRDLIGNIFDKLPFPQQSHRIFITKEANHLVGRLSLYGESFKTIILLCDNFTETFNIDGFICDWKNKKEYNILEYINSLTQKKKNR